MKRPVERYKFESENFSVTSGTESFTSSSVLQKEFSHLTPGTSHNIQQGSESAYKLRSPPHFKAPNNILSTTLNKSRLTFSDISWWIYLITCYSLLLDTCFLQSRPIMFLRLHLRQLSISKFGHRLLLFILLPMCFAIGGHKYLTMQSQSNTTLIPSPSYISFSNEVLVEKPLQNYDMLTFREPQITSKHPIPIDVVSKLEEINEEIVNLKKKLVQYGSHTEQLHALIDTKVENSIKSHIPTSFDLLTTNIKEYCKQFYNLPILSEPNSKMKSYKDQQSYESHSSFSNEIEELQLWKSKADLKLTSILNQINALQARISGTNIVMSNFFHTKIKNEVERSVGKAAQSLLHQIRETMYSEILDKMELDSNRIRGIDENEVKRLIGSAILVYDSDKTGLADYALESSGATILGTRCTDTFNAHRPTLSIWGFPLWSEPNNPRVVIQPGVVPGQCWSFKGFDGYLVVRLSRRIVPTAFSLEHIPLSLAPDGNIASAPRNFSVYCLHNESDHEGAKLGEYHYEIDGSPLQTFVVQKEAYPCSIIELRIHSNHGNLNYTCLYRFRVHGRGTN